MSLKAMSTWTDVPWYLCDKESYLSWFNFINVAFQYMQQTYFHLIMSLRLSSFPMHSKTYLKSLYFWSAETEVTLSRQINKLDVSQQVKQWNAEWTEHKLDPFTSMIY